MIAVLPCAGRGTRLADRRDDTVIKELREVAGKPMIEYSLEVLEARGVDQVVLIVAPGKEQVAKYVALRHPEWDTATVYQHVPSGTGKAVGCLDILNRAGESYLYLMPDSVHVGMPVRLPPYSSDPQVYLWKTSKPEQMGVFDWDASGKAIRHLEKKKPHWPGPYWAWGAAILSFPFVQMCSKYVYPARSGKLWAEFTIDDAFDQWMRQDSINRITVHPCDGWYVDMGTPAGIEEAEDRIRGGVVGR